MAADGTEAVKLSQFKAALAGSSGGQSGNSATEVVEFSITGSDTEISLGTILGCAVVKMKYLTGTVDYNDGYNGWVMFEKIGDHFGVVGIFLDSHLIADGYTPPEFQFDIQAAEGYTVDYSKDIGWNYVTIVTRVGSDRKYKCVSCNNLLQSVSGDGVNNYTPYYATVIFSNMGTESVGQKGYTSVNYNFFVKILAA